MVDLFIVGFVLAAVFLLSIAFNPLYITGVLVGLVLIFILFNYQKFIGAFLR